MLSLVVFVLTISNIWLVSGDEALVKEVCDGTPRPEICEQCLKGADASTDKKGLALRSIACSLRKSGVVDRALENISKNSDDPAVKDKCASCRKFIGVVGVESLKKAESLVKGDDFLAAVVFLSAAKDRWLACSELQPYLADPPSFPQDFVLLGILCQDTLSIVNKL